MDNLREDILSEESKLLISSLPSNTYYLGKLYKYQRCWYHPRILQGVLEFQESFTPQDTDIILASFPKSGTTWLKALTVALLERSKNTSPSGNDDDHPLLSHNPHSFVSFLESASDLKSPKSFSSSSPRVFSTHMPLHTLREGLKDSPCKIVYVCRNVKDVLVSLWYFINSNKEVDWGSKRDQNINGVADRTFEGMIETFCSGVSVYGPFWEHVLSYWRGSLEDPSHHVLFMRYEELKTEPHAQVKRLAEFLDCPFTKEEEESGSVDKILQLCSINNLSGLEINKTGKTEKGLGFNTYFRKGEVGDFKNHMTPEMENKIDMIIQEKLGGSDLKF